jgi:membrane-bound lytic murein transglycosylase
VNPENTPPAAENQAQNTEAAPVIRTEENQANWKAFREQREADRKAAAESQRMANQKAEEAAALRAALEALTNKPQPQQQNSYDQSEDSEDARIEKRVNEIIAQREKQYEHDRMQREQAEYPEKLRTVYSDFNKVCSTENLDYLEYHYPELATPFKHMPDGFEKWASIYKTVKKFVPNTDSKADAKKADNNLQKPGSLSSMGNASGANAMPGARLDEARKAENWQRMQRLLKSTSN